MRAAVVSILLCACAGPMRPAVIPKLSELPAEPQKRDAVLDQSHAQPGPEQQPKTPKERKVETYAATAAAVIGWFLSDSENVTLGGGVPIDETGLVPVETESQKQARKEAADAKAKETEKDKAKPAPAAIDRDVPLVPWVPLK